MDVIEARPLFDTVHLADMNWKQGMLVNQLIYFQRIIQFPMFENVRCFRYAWYKTKFLEYL
jgi:hypothetical protein